MKGGERKNEEKGDQKKKMNSGLMEGGTKEERKEGNKCREDNGRMERGVERKQGSRGEVEKGENREN